MKSSVQNKLLLFGLAFIIFFSFLSVGALVCTIYQPLPVFVVALFLSFASNDYLSKHITIDYDKSLYLKLFLVLVVAFVFRSFPFKTIHGGQDQGLYVSMSAHFERGDDLFFDDKVINDFDDPSLKILYRQNLPLVEYQPGVYYNVNKDRSIPKAKQINTYRVGNLEDDYKDYVFQFYHLHPLWMSLFGHLGGDSARFYALTFFSLLSIMGLFLLCYELTKSQLISLLLGLSLAINPLHVFFSKWQVTELVALAFTAIGLWLLTLICKQINIDRRKLIVGSSFAAVFFSLYFFTRISGFIYLPFLVFCFIVAWWYRKDEQKQSIAIPFFYFSTISIALYALSVVYGLVAAPVYAVDVYLDTFQQLQKILLPGILAVLILLGGLYFVWRNYFKNEDEKFEYNIIHYGNISLLSLFILLPFVGLLLKGNFNIQDTNLLNSLSVFNWIIYTGVISFFIALPFFIKNRKDKPLFILMVFIIIPAIFIFVLKPTIVYQYYYSRYMISELVPYSLLLIYYLLHFSKKYIAIGSTIIACSVFAFYTIAQTPAKEGEIAYDILNDISKNINKDDYLLFNKTAWALHHPPIYTPLSIYHDIQVFPVDEHQIVSITEGIAKEKTQNIYLLSPKKQVYKDFILVESYMHQLKTMEQTAHIPQKLIDKYWLQPLYLYRYIQTDLGPPRKYNFHDNAWTKGSSYIDYSLHDIRFPKRIKLSTNGWHPYRTNMDKLNLQIFINDIPCPLESQNVSNNEYYFTIPTVISKVDRVSIKCNTFIPKAIGLNNDVRRLGIDIKALEFEY